MGNACTTSDMTLSFSSVLAPNAKVLSREGHVVVCVRNESLVLWGGAVEDHSVYLLNHEGKWDILAPTPERVGSCGAAVGDRVFLFGGVDPEQGCWLNEMLELDLVTKQISSIGPGVGGPTPRDKASLITGGPAFLLLFGGFGPVFDDPMQAGDDDEEEDEDDEEEEGMDPAKFRWFNELFVYSIQHKTWRLATISNPPPARAAHGMCLTGGRVWIFGGKTESGRANDLWSVALADILQNAPNAAWKNHNPQGVIPSGRSFHSMVSIPGSSRFVVIGGRDNTDVILADVHVYDADLDAWAQPNFCENVPQSFAGSATVKGDLIVLHGANDIFVSADMSKLKSAKIELPAKAE